MNSISDTLAGFVTTQAKLIELIFESFYKDFCKTFEKIFFKSEALINF